jgi:carboxypeptidase Q
MSTKMATDAILREALDGNDEVFRRIAYICDTFGPRFSGTPALEKAIDHVVELATQDGLEVFTEPVMIPRWVRGRESLRLVSPSVREKNMAMVQVTPMSLTSKAAVGGSIGTLGKPLVAEAFVVRSFDELKERAANASGKIVVYNAPFVSYGETVEYRFAGVFYTVEMLID